MKAVQLISFRRSGTHFLQEIIKLNFNYRSHVGHPAFDSHTASIFLREIPCIYIYRDCRPVLKSLYNFLKYSKWRIWDGVSVKFRANFSEFLRGQKIKLVNVNCPTIRALLTNPVQAWVDHTQWINPLTTHSHFGQKIFSIKYEELVKDQAGHINIISEYLNKKIDTPVIVKEMVSQNPKVDRVEYTSEDLDYVWRIAGTRMKDLGYE